MKTERRFLTILLVAFVGPFLAGNGHGQSETPMPANPGLTCSPAPCVLPPTQASEGGGTVTDTPIVTNPLNGKELLLGSVDYNCGRESELGFHLSTDSGSIWERVDCMAAIIIKQNNYLPLDEPSVGYDRNGNAYVAGVYSDQAGYGYRGLVAVQKSTDGTHWSKPVVALRRPGKADEYLTHLAVDTSTSSRWVNSVYVSGVVVSGRGYNQVWVSHSSDGGGTWTQVAIDAAQKYPKEDNLTRVAAGKDGTVYVTWLSCSSPCQEGRVMLSMSTDGGNTLVFAPAYSASDNAHRLATA
jgi:hypothetical protein